MTELLRQFFGDSLIVPLVFPLIGLGSLQSHCHFSQLHYFMTQSNFHRLCSSHSVTPKGSSCHMFMTTPCRIDDVMSFKSVFWSNLITILSLVFFYQKLLVVFYYRIQVTPGCGLYWMKLEMACFIIAQVRCTYILPFLILNNLMLTSGVCLKGRLHHQAVPLICRTLFMCLHSPIFESGVFLSKKIWYCS